MSTTVRLSKPLIDNARIHGEASMRSIPRQIEYWAKLGKIAEENPDLPFSFIREILVALEEVKAGKATEFKFES